MKFLDIEGVKTLWNGAKDKFAPKEAFIIEDYLVVRTNVLHSCVASTGSNIEGTVVLTKDFTNTRYELGIIVKNSRNTFNSISCGNLTNNGTIAKYADGVVLKKAILHNTNDNKYYVPISPAYNTYKQYDNLQDAFAALYWQQDDTAITDNWLNENLV